MSELLRVSGLSIAGLLHDVSFTVARGQRLGIIGESGSGKSLTALAVMGLLPDNLIPRVGGSVLLDDTEIIGLPDRRMRRLRGTDVAMVFQEPMSALDPMMTVGRQVLEAARGAETLRDALFTEVGLDGKQDRYPHELSGGQRQRVLIAMAIAGDPDVLICDEPTTALDVTVQAQILTLIDRLVTERDMALVFITHDLGVIARMCTDVLVLRDGAVVDRGPADSLLHHPGHEYTRALIDAAKPGPPALPREHGRVLIDVGHVSTEHILDDVSLQVRRGERLGIVGGSGSGKTTLLRLIAGLASPSAGTVAVDGRVQVVFQDPQSSLNPRLTVRKSVAEGGPRVSESLAEVGLPADAGDRYPHQFSGGQRQRISIARAIAGRPEILLADEPVSALDVSVRAQVLDVLDGLVTDHGLTLVFVSHDLSVVRSVCDTVAVVHEGRIVEHGPTESVWANPQHEYTRTLLAAIPTTEA